MNKLNNLTISNGSNEKIWSNKQMDEISSSPNYMAAIFDDIYTRYQPQNILDIGCGNGHFTSYFKKYNVIIHGIDGSEYGIQESLKNGFDKCFKVSNFDYDDLKTDQIYDLIICKDVLEHILHPIDLIDKATHNMNKNSLMLISAPNHFSIYYRLKFLFSGDIDVPNFFPGVAKWAYPHIRFMRHQDMVEMFKIHNLDIVKDYTEHFFFFLPRGNGLFIKLGLNKILTSWFPNLFSSGYTFLVKLKSNN